MRGNVLHLERSILLVRRLSHVLLCLGYLGLVVWHLAISLVSSVLNQRGRRMEVSKPASPYQLVLYLIISSSSSSCSLSLSVCIPVVVESPHYQPLDRGSYFDQVSQPIIFFTLSLSPVSLSFSLCLSPYVYILVLYLISLPLNVCRLVSNTSTILIKPFIPALNSVDSMRVEFSCISEVL